MHPADDESRVKFFIILNFQNGNETSLFLTWLQMLFFTTFAVEINEKRHGIHFVVLMQFHLRTHQLLQECSGFNKELRKE
jgi:hypothetical protein